jgi:hypothetical protein
MVVAAARFAGSCACRPPARGPPLSRRGSERALARVCALSVREWAGFVCTARRVGALRCGAAHWSGVEWSGGVVCFALRYFRKWSVFCVVLLGNCFLRSCLVRTCLTTFSRGTMFLFWEDSSHGLCASSWDFITKKNPQDIVLCLKVKVQYPSVSYYSAYKMVIKVKLNFAKFNYVKISPPRCYRASK